MKNSAIGGAAHGVQLDATAYDDSRDVPGRKKGKLARLTRGLVGTTTNPRGNPKSSKVFKTADELAARNEALFRKIAPKRSRNADETDSQYGESQLATDEAKLAAIQDEIINGEAPETLQAQLVRPADHRTEEATHAFLLKDELGFDPKKYEVDAHGLPVANQLSAAGKAEALMYMPFEQMNDLSKNVTSRRALKGYIAAIPREQGAKDLVVRDTMVRRLITTLGQANTEHKANSIIKALGQELRSPDISQVARQEAITAMLGLVEPQGRVTTQRLILTEMTQLINAGMFLGNDLTALTLQLGHKISSFAYDDRSGARNLQEKAYKLFRGLMTGEPAKILGQVHQVALNPGPGLAPADRMEIIKRIAPEQLKEAAVGNTPWKAEDYRRIHRIPGTTIKSMRLHSASAPARQTAGELLGEFLRQLTPMQPDREPVAAFNNLLRMHQQGQALEAVLNASPDSSSQSHEKLVEHTGQFIRNFEITARYFSEGVSASFVPIYDGLKKRSLVIDANYQRENAAIQRDYGNRIDAVDKQLGDIAAELDTSDLATAMTPQVMAAVNIPIERKIQIHTEVTTLNSQKDALVNEQSAKFQALTERYQGVKAHNEGAALNEFDVALGRLQTLNGMEFSDLQIQTLFSRLQTIEERYSVEVRDLEDRLNNVKREVNDIRRDHSRLTGWARTRNKVSDAEKDFARDLAPIVAKRDEALKNVSIALADTMRYALVNPLVKQLKSLPNQSEGMARQIGGLDGYNQAMHKISTEENLLGVFNMPGLDGPESEATESVSEQEPPALERTQSHESGSVRVTESSGDNWLQKGERKAPAERSPSLAATDHSLPFVEDDEVPASAVEERPETTVGQQKMRAYSEPSIFIDNTNVPIEDYYKLDATALSVRTADKIDIEDDEVPTPTLPRSPSPELGSPTRNYDDYFKSRTSSDLFGKRSAGYRSGALVTPEVMSETTARNRVSSGAAFSQAYPAGAVGEFGSGHPLRALKAGSESLDSVSVHSVRRSGLVKEDNPLDEPSDPYRTTGYVRPTSS